MTGKRDYRAEAEELIRQRLMQNADPGVRAITAAFGVPDYAIEQVAASLRRKAEKAGQ